MPVSVGPKTITSAGTAEALTTRSIICQSVIIRAKSTNTGVVYICDDATRTVYFPADGLSPKEAVTVPINNPALIYVDVSVAGEGVDWLAV